MTRFALAPAASRLEPLGEHVLVFDESSWDTHVLNEAAGALLLAIAEAPRAMGELVALLHELLNDAERDHAESHARSTVGRLQSLGLIIRETRL